MRQISAEDLANFLSNGKFAIRNDMFDREAYQEILDSSSKLLTLREEGAAISEVFPELLQDVFSLLYKRDPELAQEFELDREHIFNLVIAENLAEQHRIKEIRVLSQMDPLMSAVGINSMAEDLKELVKDTQEQMAANAAAAGEGEEAGDGEDSDEEADGIKGPQKPDPLTIDEAKAWYEEERKKIQAALDDPKVKKHMNKMVTEAKHSVMDADATINRWGLGSDNSYTTTDYRQKFELINRLQNNKKLRQIAELAGKLIPIAMVRQSQKIKKGIDEVYSIECGRDITRILPQEKAKLQDPLREVEFMINYLEGKCLQYSIRGKEKKVKGAIVVCIDESGSMCGEPEVWAKAVALALLNIAVKQKRDFYAIHFDGEPNPDRLKSHYFPRSSPPSSMELIEFAEFFLNGGTDFEAPLTRARNCIETQANFHKADIIFITDGDCTVTDTWLKDFRAWKALRAVTIYSILIDAGHNTAVSLKEFSNTIYPLRNLTTDAENTVLELFINV